MKKKVYTSVAIVITLALLFVLKWFVSDYFFDAFFAVLACFGGYEMSKLLTKIGRYNHLVVGTAFPALLFAGNLVGIHFIALTGDLFWILYTILIDLAIMLLTFLCVFLFDLCRKKAMLNEMSVRKIYKTKYQKFALQKAFNTLICFFYPAFLFLFFNFLNHLGEMPLSKLGTNLKFASLFVLLTALLIPILTDTFAMLTGSLIGGKKLCPKISPNKTISGSIGGILWCVLFCACVYLIFNCVESFQPFFATLPIWAYLIVAFVGSIVAQCGDLFESIIKRRAGVHDSGKFLPGHGGALDRTDSHIFMAPFIFVVFLICLL